MKNKPLMWGLIASSSMLLAYFLVLTLANSVDHAIEQLVRSWYWMTPLVLGFGIQAGLFSYIKNNGVASSSMAATGGVSTTSMIACCAHHLTDVLPLIGLSAAMIFLTEFQSLFIVIGLVSTLIGINLMLKIIQEHRLYKGGFLSKILKLNMKKTLYVNSVISGLVILVTIRSLL